MALVVPVKAASAAAVANPADIPAASGLLVFKAKSLAWVRVSDSRGVVQFEKTLAPGESAAASGAMPLSVVVGNVAATEVVLRGQPFPLDTLNQNNVARFEVK
jgi:cytoskeleton protein RodZ